MNVGAEEFGPDMARGDFASLAESLGGKNPTPFITKHNETRG